MKRTDILKNTPQCKAPERESEEVLAVSQVVEYEKTQILNIDLFYKGRLTGRYFADKEERSHAASVGGKWYSCMMNNVARVCKGMDTVKGDSYYFGNDWEFSTKKDKMIALNYLGVHYLTEFEISVNQVKYERAYQRKCQRINERMGNIPCVPDEMEAWVQREIFQENYLFFARKSKNRTEYSCTACGSQGWKKKGWKHGERVLCPKCGAPVKAYSRKQERSARERVVLLQACGREWVERQFHAVCTWKEGERKQVELYEDMRAVIPKGECWGKVYYGIQADADEFSQEWWDRNQRSKRFMASYLYPGNLEEVLLFGELQGSGLDVIGRNKEKINVNKFIATFHKRPWIEYLAKAGLCRLVADIMDQYGWWGNPKNISEGARSVSEALQLDGNRTYRMKRINGGLNTLSWLQYEQEMEAQGKRIKISQESLEYLHTKKVEKSECEEILKELGSVNRMVNYMKKQKISPRTLTQTWRDYLQMARQEGMDTTDDIVRLPRDLKARHDQLVELINARRDAEELEKAKKRYKRFNKELRKRLPEVKRYFWENDIYMIVPAGTCEELVAEGRALHHCVGSGETYMRRMAKGISWICFLRRKRNPEKPYYTIEVDLKTDGILQWYSEFDRKPDQETIRKVLENYKRSIRKPQVRVRIQEAAMA